MIALKAFLYLMVPICLISYMGAAVYLVSQFFQSTPDNVHGTMGAIMIFGMMYTFTYILVRDEN